MSCCLTKHSCALPSGQVSGFGTAGVSEPLGLLVYGFGAAGHCADLVPRSLTRTVNTVLATSPVPSRIAQGTCSAALLLLPCAPPVPHPTPPPQEEGDGGAEEDPAGPGTSNGADAGKGAAGKGAARKTKKARGGSDEIDQVGDH